ncbi:MAG: ABC transporter permease [Anaerorhabdus sp.]
MIIEYLKLSINELVNNRLRSFLSLIGIVIGVAVVFIIFSISDITNVAITNEISGTGGVFKIYYVSDKADSTVVFRESLGLNFNSFSQTKKYDVEDIEVLSEVEGIENAMGNFSVDEVVKVDDKSVNTSIMRHNKNFLDYHGLSIVYGSDIEAYSGSKKNNAVIISESFAKNYLELSNEEAIGKRLIIKNRNFTIVGIVENSSSLTAMMALSEGAYDSMFSQTTMNAISIKIAPGYPLEDTAKKAIDYLNHINGFTDTAGGYALEDLTFLISQIQVVTGILSLVMGVIASISLLVAGIGVMNIMLVSVVERTREIGVKRAIGASKKAIQFQFIVESCLLTFIGGLIGVLIGMGIVKLVLQGLDMSMPINMGYVIFALLFSISLGLLFGYLPSKRAANLNIIEAIQSE